MILEENLGKIGKIIANLKVAPKVSYKDNYAILGYKFTEKDDFEIKLKSIISSLGCIIRDKEDEVFFLCESAESLARWINSFLDDAEELK